MLVLGDGVKQNRICKLQKARAYLVDDSKKVESDIVIFHRFKPQRVC